jgi:hypothetical protein
MQFAHIFDLVGGRRLPEEEDGPAHRYRLMIGGVVATALCAAIYGAAAGTSWIAHSETPWMGALDLVKLPMVLILSALAAVPASLLAWKLFDARHACTDLLMGLVTANLTAASVLAVSAPLVALYYLTTDFLGGTLAIGVACGAVIVGVLSGMRSIAWRVPEDVSVLRYAPVIAVMTGVQLLALVQLVALASPILPEMTVFDGGMDSILE